MRLRLRLFSYIHLGTRTYDPRGYHFHDWFRPLGEAPQNADLLGDPDDIRLVAVCAREGSEQAQSYVGDAYSVTLQDADAPVSLDDLRAILHSRTPTEPRARAHELLDAHLQGKRLKPKEAAEVERFVRKAMRTTAAPTVTRPPEAFADLELPRRSVFAHDPSATNADLDPQPTATDAETEEEEEMVTR